MAAPDPAQWRRLSPLLDELLDDLERQATGYLQAHLRLYDADRRAVEGVRGERGAPRRPAHRPAGHLGGARQREDLGVQEGHPQLQRVRHRHLVLTNQQVRQERRDHDRRVDRVREVVQRPGHDDEGRPVVLLDTRNGFEEDAGAFEDVSRYQISAVFVDSFGQAFEVVAANFV